METSGTSLKVDHVALVATLENGMKVLVHKGPNFADRDSSQTVVVDVTNGGMSSKWEPKSPVLQAKDGVKVHHLVETGGKDYNVVFDNCKHGVNKMIEEAGHENSWFSWFPIP